MRATALYPSRISQQSGPASGGAFLALTVASASSASQGWRMRLCGALTHVSRNPSRELLLGAGLYSRRFAQIRTRPNSDPQISTLFVGLPSHEAAGQHFRATASSSGRLKPPGFKPTRPPTFRHEVA